MSTSLGPYAGVLRETLLAYKERGRHRLARPLGALLAEVVAGAVGTPRPLLLSMQRESVRRGRLRPLLLVESSSRLVARPRA